VHKVLKFLVDSLYFPLCGAVKLMGAARENYKIKTPLSFIAVTGPIGFSSVPHEI